MSPPESVSMPPLLTVVKGNPSPEELAALLAVVANAGSGAAPEKSAGAVSLWAAPQLRRPVHPGPQAWRASGLPG